MFLEQSIILIQIIFIDIVMAADNAIIIGMIAANFAPDNRKKIIAFGVAAAFIFRVAFALSATYLLAFAWIKIVGGVLLLWVIYNLRKDLFESKKIRSPSLRFLFAAPGTDRSVAGRRAHPRKLVQRGQKPDP